MRILVIAAVAAMLAGCSTFGMSGAQIAQMDQSKCQGYGFKLGSEAFASCMQQLDLSREEDQRSRGRALSAAGGYLLNDTQPITCNSRGTSFGSISNTTTTCR